MIPRIVAGFYCTEDKLAENNAFNNRMLIMFKIYNLKAAEVHGNLSQQERMNSIEEF